MAPSTDTPAPAHAAHPPHHAPASDLHEQRRLTLDAITDFAYIFGLDGRFKFINKPLLDLWGLTLDQAVNKNFFDLGYPHDLAAKLQRQIQQVIDTRQRLVDETPYTSPTGIDGFYQYIFSPVLAPDGSLLAVAGSTRDISDHKRLEALRASLTRAVESERATLASIIEHAPAFICILRGPNHVFELANDYYYQMVGDRDIIGKSVRQAFPEVEGQGFFERLDHTYKTGEPFTGTELPIDLRRPSDNTPQRHYINFVYQALRDSDNAITGIFVHGVDVTDSVTSREILRQRDASLRTSEERLAFALDAADLGTFYCPMPFGEIIWNDTCKQHFWLSPDAVINFDLFYSIIHPEDREATRRAVELSVYGKKPYDAIYRTVSPDGRIRWVRAKGRAYYDAAGNPTRFDGITIDVTEQKRAEMCERIARAEAETANLAKDKFIAVLSHELRTPLSPVVMTIPALEADPELPPRFKDDLAMIRRNIDLEVKLIDDLLDLSRVTTGKLRLQMQPVALHEVLRHAIHSSLSDAAGKKLQLKEDLAAANDNLLADPARLQQVFWNLLRNAVKFTPDGGTITVRTTNSSNAKRLKIEVLDTGVGIPPDVLPHIFDAFEQGDARVTRQFGGLGLGLAIAKAVVELHGGSITAASAGKNRGAAFTVELNTAAPKKNAAAIAPAEPSSPAPTTPIRVLLVEDHPDTARSLARVLTSSGFNIQTAYTVKDALRLADSNPFDVLVSDIGLPDATGYDLMRQISQKHRIKGIALSGYGMEDDARKSREAGFVEHIVKPVNIAQLESTLRRVAEPQPQP